MPKQVAKCIWVSNESECDEEVLTAIKDEQTIEISANSDACTKIKLATAFCTGILLQQSDNLCL